jgi:hypothetical protein
MRQSPIEKGNYSKFYLAACGLLLTHQEERFMLPYPLKGIIFSPLSPLLFFPPSPFLPRLSSSFSPLHFFLPFSFSPFSSKRLMGLGKPQMQFYSLKNAVSAPLSIGGCTSPSISCNLLHPKGENCNFEPQFLTWLRVVEIYVLARMKLHLALHPPNVDCYIHF